MSVTEIMCSCGLVAIREAANRVAITEPSADTRGMFRRFTEASHELAHTTGSESSNDWQRAKQRAQAITSAGEAKDVLTAIRGV